MARAHRRQLSVHLQEILAFLLQVLEKATVESEVAIKVGESTLRIPLTVWANRASKCKVLAFDCPHRKGCRRGGNTKPNAGLHCAWALLKHATSCTECTDPEVSEQAQHQLAG